MTRKILHSIALSTVLVATAAIAQPGHGYPPPGQMKHDDRRDDRYDNRGPNANQDWRFRGDERDRFNRYYGKDVRRWQKNRNRPQFTRGYVIPRTYRIQPVPRNYWQGMQAPPPGYQYGYYDGYVVSYNPTTRIIADVMDLVGAVANR